MKAHAEFEIVRVDRWVVSGLVGAWNREGLAAYVAAFKEIASGLQAGWFSVADVSRFELFDVNDGDLLADFFEWCRIHGCSRTLHIGAGQLAKFVRRRIVSGSIQPLPAVTDCDSIADAITQACDAFSVTAWSEPERQVRFDHGEWTSSASLTQLVRAHVATREAMPERKSGCFADSSMTPKR